MVVSVPVYLQWSGRLPLRPIGKRETQLLIRQVTLSLLACPSTACMFCICPFYLASAPDVLLPLHIPLQVSSHTLSMAAHVLLRGQ